MIANNLSTSQMAYIITVNANIISDTGGTCNSSDCTVRNAAGCCVRAAAMSKHAGEVRQCSCSFTTAGAGQELRVPVLRPGLRRVPGGLCSYPAYVEHKYQPHVPA